jgi:hypothetical protein
VSRKNPGRAAGGDGLGRHRFGSGGQGGFGLWGRRAGLGDAGNEALGQLDRTLQGAAGVAADVFVGREGDHEVEDAPSGIAGSDGDGGSCCFMPSTRLCRVAGAFSPKTQQIDRFCVLLLGIIHTPRR